MLRLGGPVLDRGLCTGTIALIRLGGPEVVGVDSSPSCWMCPVRTSSRPGAGKGSAFLKGDMQSFPWEKQFASALLARNSFACLLSTQSSCVASATCVICWPWGGKK